MDKKNNLSKDLKVIGYDSTNMMTGHKGGAIHYVEEGIGHSQMFVEYLPTSHQ